MYHKGIVRFGIDDSKNILNHPNIHAVYLSNLTLTDVINLPTNIRTILVEDMKDLTRIQKWLMGEEYNYKQHNLTLRYKGPHTDLIPVFDRINPSIVHLLLPLNQDLIELIENNPHLKSIGIDLDKKHIRNKKDIPIDFVAYGSNEHRLRHISRLNPLNVYQYRSLRLPN